MALGGFGAVLIEEIGVTFSPAIDLGFGLGWVGLLPGFDAFGFGDGSAGSFWRFMVEAGGGVVLGVVAHALEVVGIGDGFAPLLFGEAEMGGFLFEFCFKPCGVGVAVAAFFGGDGDGDASFVFELAVGSVEVFGALVVFAGEVVKSLLGWNLGPSAEKFALE